MVEIGGAEVVGLGRCRVCGYVGGLSSEGCPRCVERALQEKQQNCKHEHWVPMSGSKIKEECTECGQPRLVPGYDPLKGIHLGGKKTARKCSLTENGHFFCKKLV